MSPPKPTENYLKFVSDINEIENSNDNLQQKSNKHVNLYKQLVDNDAEVIFSDENKLKRLEQIQICLNSVFFHVKKRDSLKVSSEFMLNLFYEATAKKNLSKSCQDIHEHNMAQMIHPNWGYLTKFKVNSFLFNFYPLIFRELSLIWKV